MAALARQWWSIGLAVACGSLQIATAASGATLKTQNLAALIGDSQSIVAGTVRSVTDGIDARGIPFTEVTIAVGDAAKGSIPKGKDYTFRQFGLLKPRTLPNGHRLLAATPDGFPHWYQGEYVVAFLRKPASRTALQTTAGLAQGKLTRQGDKLLSEFGNRGLFDNLKTAPGLMSSRERAVVANPRDLKAADLMSLIGRAVKEQWVEKGVLR